MKPKKKISDPGLREQTGKGKTENFDENRLFKRLSSVSSENKKQADLPKSRKKQEEEVSLGQWEDEGGS